MPPVCQRDLLCLVVVVGEDTCLEVEEEEDAYQAAVCPTATDRGRVWCKNYEKYSLWSLCIFKIYILYAY